MLNIDAPYERENMVDLYTDTHTAMGIAQGGCHSDFERTASAWNDRGKDFFVGEHSMEGVSGRFFRLLGLYPLIYKWHVRLQCGGVGAIVSVDGHLFCRPVHVCQKLLPKRRQLRQHLHQRQPRVKLWWRPWLQNLAARWDSRAKQAVLERRSMFFCTTSRFLHPNGETESDHTAGLIWFAVFSTSGRRSSAWSREWKG